MFEVAINDQKINTAVHRNGNKLSTKFILATAGLIGGFMTLLTGLIMLVISAVSQTSAHFLDVWLLIVSFTLLILGAHFLDQADAEEKAARVEFCKKHGLTIKECEQGEFIN